MVHQPPAYPALSQRRTPTWRPKSYRQAANFPMASGTGSADWDPSKMRTWSSGKTRGASSSSSFCRAQTMCREIPSERSSFFTAINGVHVVLPV